MNEPFYVNQTGPILNREAGDHWLNLEIARLRREGAGWMRASFDEATQSVLIEAWHEKPDDEGPQRWKEPAA